VWTLVFFILKNYTQKVKLPLCRGIISTIKIMFVTLGLKHPGKQLLRPKEEVNRWEICEAATWIALVMTE